MLNSLVLLKILADGRFHSGQRLAGELGLSRAAIWKQIRQIEAMGLEVDAVRGKGYRLREPLEWLDPERVRQQMSGSVQACIGAIDYPIQIDSTNLQLMRQHNQWQADQAYICLTESQSAGKGRRGRQWLSPFGRNLYFSVGMICTGGPAALSALSLALGVVSMRVLQPYLERQAGLKWPNDIVCDGRKLGGILLEMRGEAAGPCAVVAGLGLNLRMPTDTAEGIDQPWTDLHQVSHRSDISRNQLLTTLLEQWVVTMLDYTQTGFAPYMAEWQAWDLMAQQAVEIHFPGGSRQGIARGVNSDGALLLEENHHISPVNSGEVSLRMPA